MTGDVGDQKGTIPQLSMRENIKRIKESHGYGHVGDGNIHLNVVPPQDYDIDQRKALFAKAQDIIFNVVDDFNGSISAEHGIGRSKKDAFLQRVDPVTLDLFQKLKHTLDPDNILSRGRIFDT